MFLECSGVKLDVLDTFVSLSPYLEQRRYERIIDMNHVNLANLREYVNYINGLNFTINLDFFEYMGTINTYKYPLEFWKVKLIDTRFRDFHEVILRSDPYAGLIEISFIRDRLEEVLMKVMPGKDLFIAGGAALYIAGITDKYHDIDIFTTNMRTVDNIAENLGKTVAFISDHALTVGRAQYILRNYKYASQIPHGFDVGCCGVIIDIDGEKCYITNRAKYSIDNSVNWLEPDRSSPTYIKRLCKYATRGFQIMLPLVNGLYLNTKTITNFKLDMIYTNEGQWYAPIDINMTDIKDYTNRVIVTNDIINELDKYREPIINATRLAKNPILREFVAFYTLDVDDNALALVRYNDDADRKYFTDCLPNDDASALILMSCLGIYSTIKYSKSEDYGNKYNMYDGRKLSWTKIDPMKQLTGTFHVENIHDLLNWYKSSPVVSTNDRIPIVTKQQRDHSYINIELMD